MSFNFFRLQALALVFGILCVNAGCQSNIFGDSTDVLEVVTDTDDTNEEGILLPPGNEFSVDLPAGLDVGALKVEVAGMSGGKMVVKGNLPIPPGIYPRQDGKKPFLIEHTNGESVPAQIEIVSRYPDVVDSNGVSAGADVVEVLAYVDELPADSEGMAVYKIRAGLIDYGAPDVSAGARGLLLKTQNVPTSIATFLASGDPLVVAAFDENGCRYEHDILSGAVTVERYGPVMTTVRTHAFMQPVSGTCAVGSPKSHFFGVHAFVSTLTNQETLLIDFVFHNGPENETIGFLGNLWFAAVGLYEPTGMQLINSVNDPYFRAYRSPSGPLEYSAASNFQPIVDQINHGTYVDVNNGTNCYEGPNEEGDLHVLPNRGTIMRRMALVLPASTNDTEKILQDFGQGFAVRGINSDGGKYFSWQNPTTARYFPQAMLLPDISHDPSAVVSLRNREQTSYASFKNTRETGCASNFVYSQNYSNPTTDLTGHAMGYGIKYGGFASGVNIQAYEGLGAILGYSRESYARNKIYFEMNKSRDWRALFKADGEPFDPNDYAMSNHERRYNNDFLLGPWISGSESPAYMPNNWQTKTNPGETFYEFFAAVANTPSVGSREPGYKNAFISPGPNNQAFQQHDAQHYRRGTVDSMSLVWVGNDPMAKLFMRLYGKLAMGTFDFRLPQGTNATTYMPHAMKDLAVDAANLDGSSQAQNILQTFQNGGSLTALTGKLNQGVGFGRAEAWMIDVANATYRVESEQWRQDHHLWFVNAMEALFAGVSICSGFVLRQMIMKVYGNLTLDDQWMLQMFEEGYGQLAMMGMLRSVFEGYDVASQTKALSVLGDSTKGMYSSAWSHGLTAPFYIIGLSPSTSENYYYFENFDGPASTLQQQTCTGPVVPAGQDAPINPIGSPAGTSITEGGESLLAPVFGVLAGKYPSFDYLDRAAQLKGQANASQLFTYMQNNTDIDNADGYQFSFDAILMAWMQLANGIL